MAAAIRAFFADGHIERSAYEHLIDQMPGDDPDDHPHMAAAVAARADALVTANGGDFPQEPLPTLGVRVMGPDAYLCELLAEYPDEIVTTVVRMAAEKTRPPRTPSELLAALRAAGLGDGGPGSWVHTVLDRPSGGGRLLLRCGCSRPQIRRRPSMLVEMRLVEQRYQAVLEVLRGANVVEAAARAGGWACRCSWVATRRRDPLPG